MGNEEIRDVLDEVVRQQQELKNEFHKKKKDVWDKLSIASSFISGVILAVLGIYFTQSYNQKQAQLIRQQGDDNKRQVEHQMKLAEIQTVGTFIPYLAGADENQTKAAILAISGMTNTELAGEIAKIFTGKGAIQAMATIANKGNASDKRVASETLASIASSNKPEDRKAAVDALRVINNNPLDLQAPDKSTINVEVTAEGTVPMVNYSLNGEARVATSFSFQLDKAKNDPAILVLLFSFSNPDGGVYNIKVTGSGGISSHFTVRQTGMPVATIAYTFDVI